MKATNIPIEWHEGLSIYASEAFLRTVGDAYGWLGGIDDSGELRCILPYTIIRKSIIQMVRFRVETIPVGEDLSLEDEKAFLNSAISYFRSAGMDLIVPASTNTIFRTYPDGAIAAPYRSYIIDLRQPIERLWSNVSHKYRKEISTASKNGVRVISGIEHINTAYEMIRDTYKRAKLPFMKFDAFKRILTGLEDHMNLMIAEYQGIPQSCTAFHFSKHCAYAVHGGSIQKPISGAMKLVQWEAIKLFRDLGVQRFDFLGARVNPEKGSKQEGIMLFKQYLGGAQKKGYMWKFAFSPIRYAAYAIGVRLLWGGDIVDNERHKLGHEEIDDIHLC